MRHVVVVGGGITGLAATRRLMLAAGDRPLRVTLVESSQRLGGKVLSERCSDFLVEGGPDSFIPQKPQTLELVHDLGLGDRLMASNDDRRGLSVVHRDRLVRLPPGLQMLVPGAIGDVLRTPLLSWWGKLRLLGERWVPPRAADPADDDESLAHFVERRFGRQVLDRLAEPLLAHIHVGDARRMSLAATYPRFAALERRYGSLSRGLATLRRGGAAAGGPAANGPPSSGPPSSGPPSRGPNPLFWTLDGGMGELTSALAKSLTTPDTAGARVTVRRGRSVATLGPPPPGGSRHRLVLDDGETLDADAVILAVPAFAAARLLADRAPTLARQLDSLRYVSLATLSLGYVAGPGTQLPEGFGFFLPARSRRTILACTFTSTKFEGRAPRDGVLVRAFLGGATQEDVLDRDDDELVAAVRRDLAELAGLHAEPTMTRLHRWPRGYPQYELGHLDRLSRLEENLPEALVVAGSGYRGVGLSDCIQDGYAAADRVAVGLVASFGEEVAEVGAG